MVRQKPSTIPENNKSTNSEFNTYYKLNLMTMKQLLQKAKFLMVLAGLSVSYALSAQIDATSIITNPSFETGDLSGWTWSGADGYGWLGPNKDGDATKNGSYICGIWNSSIGDSECSQSISSIQDGFYKITALVSVSNGRSTNQRLFASSNGKTVSQLYGASTNPAYSEANLNILKASESYTFGGYSESGAENGPFKKLSVICPVVNGTITFGVRVSGKANAFGYDFSYTNKGDAGFFKFDNFTLTEVSAVATLDNLTLNTGRLDATFNPATETYTATLPVGTTAVTPLAIPSVEGCLIIGNEEVDVTSGTGKSEITVFSLDGSIVKVYTINYVVLSLSDDATLSALAPSIGKFTVDFTPGVTDYKLLVPMGTTAVTVSAVKNNSKASVAGTGEVQLVDGKGVASIVVTAEKGNKQTYTVAIDQDYLINPSFETNDFTGWTWTGADGFIWLGVNNDADETKTGNYIAGCWNPAYGDVELTQTVVGLKNGVYQVTADLMGSSNSTTSRLTTQRLFANNASMLFGAESAYSPENLAILSATEAYSFGGYTETESDRGPLKTLTVLAPVTDGTLKLGIRTNGTQSALGFTFPNLTAGNGHGWFKVDNFTMTYYGPNTIVKQEKTFAGYRVSNGILSVKGCSGFSVYNMQGSEVAKMSALKSEGSLALKPGLYLVRTLKNDTFKVLVK
jgi:hypothetical protein